MGRVGAWVGWGCFVSARQGEPPLRPCLSAHPSAPRPVPVPLGPRSLWGERHLRHRRRLHLLAERGRLAVDLLDGLRRLAPRVRRAHRARHALDHPAAPSRATLRHLLRHCLSTLQQRGVRQPALHLRVLHRAPHAGAAHLVWVRVRVHVSSGDSPSPSPARRTLPLRSRTIASRGLTSDAMTTSPMRRSRTCAPLQPQEKTAVGFWSRIAAVVAIVAYTPPIPEITRSTVTPPMVPRVLRMAPVSGTSEQSSMRARRYLASSSMAHITSTWLMASLEERE